jgi:hypothetical protein
VITTHALFALKVQPKVSNGIAGLAADGASLDPQKSRANSRLQRCRSMANVGVYRLLKSGFSRRRSSNANSLSGQNSAGSRQIYATFQSDNLRRHL